MREDDRGKIRGGGDRAPFIDNTVGSGGRPAGGATRRRGVGEGRGVAGSGPTSALAGGASAREVRDLRQNRGEAMLTSEPQHSNGRHI
jgi:hypothetical protein